MVRFRSAKGLIKKSFIHQPHALLAYVALQEKFINMKKKNQVSNNDYLDTFDITFEYLEI